MAKVHSDLKVREKASLAGLEKALMVSGSETEEEIGMSQKKEMVEEEMFDAFMAEQTFLVEKPVEENHSKEPVSNEIPECSMQDVSEVIDLGGQEGKQVQPAIQFGSFSPVSVNMVHILPQEFQAGDENQEGQEIDLIPISSEDSQASMVQDNSGMVTPMETEYESEEVVSINLSYPFEYPSNSMTQHVKPLYF
mgnify:FL=1